MITFFIISLKTRYFQGVWFITFVKFREKYILFSGLILGALFWVFDALLDTIFNPQGLTYWDRLIFAIPTHELLNRGIILGLCCFLGILAYVFVKKLRLSYGKLQQSEREKNLILDSVKDIVIYYANDSLEIKWMNQSGRNVVSEIKKHGKDRKCYDFWFDQQNRCEDCPVYTTFHTGKSMMIHKSTTNNRSWLIHTFPITNMEGKVDGVIETITDITKFSQLERKLLQSQKLNAIGKVTSQISHDFNNYLTVILGNLDIIALELDSNSSLYQHFQDIQNAANNAKEIATQLLSFGRDNPMKKSLLDLNAIIRSNLIMYRNLIGEKINLTVNILDSPLYIHSNRTQVEQILLNLITNARDAILDQGTINISTIHFNIPALQMDFFGQKIHPDMYVCLLVSDSGIGMDQTTLEHLFEPFYSTKGMGKGTGLGLSIIYSIIQQNEAYLLLETQKKIGTKFFILFPNTENKKKE